MLHGKHKYTKSFVEATFSVMVLGLAFLSFHPEQQNVAAGTLGNAVPSISGTPTIAPSSSVTPGSNESPTVQPTATPSPTSTPTPSPTPTPSLGELNSTIPIQPAADTAIGNDITEIITNYLNAYYGADYDTLKTMVPEGDLFTKEFLADVAEDVSQIANITCYYKQGLSYADYIVYVCYEIKYTGSTVFIPTIEEFCISYQEDTSVATVYPTVLDDDVAEALYLSRVSDTVSELYIKQTILRYVNAKLACDETILRDIVTNSTLIDIDDISTKTQYIEKYNNVNFIIRTCPEEITDIDHVVYVSYDVKIINISTLAPGADEYMISFDTENYPKIFFGTTSPETDEFLIESHKEEDYLTLYNDVLKRLEDAILSDSTLREFVHRIYDATQE